MNIPLLLIPVLAAPLLVLGIAPAAALWRRRGARPAVRRPVPAPPLVVPSVEETAAAIERFRAAVRRFKREEFDRRRTAMRVLTEADGGGILRRRRPRRTAR